MAGAIKWSDLELINKLGEGQAGEVWLAKLRCSYNALPSGSFLAVKIYKNWVLEEAGQFERIIRELEVGRRVVQPNLVRSFSIIRNTQGNPALVMAYYTGETLEEYLENMRIEKKVVDVEFAFKIIHGLASALSALHNAGAIHRDVKPANVILSSSNPILMDLGVVKSSYFPEQSTSGAFLGTIRYAAPEYLFGEEYDSRVDIYSLGAIVFELFKGELFLSGETQWARLVVAKTSNYYGDFSNYRELKDRYGMNVGAFVSSILKLTLTELKNRTLTLDNLLNAVRQRLWEKPFYVDRGIFVEGEPKVLPFGEWTYGSPTVHLKDAIADLNNRLSREDRDYLHRIVDDDYWFGSYVQLAENERTRRLIEAGTIKLSHPEWGSDPWFEYHQSVMAAYRYGYL